MNIKISGVEALTVLQLKAEFTKRQKTYLEDWFLQRITHEITSGCLRGMRIPGRNRCWLDASNLEFDFSWRSIKLAIEIQGGIDSKSRRSGHVSPQGMRRDIYKIALAQTQGWIILQLTPEMITKDWYWQKLALPWIKKAASVQLERGLPAIP